MSKKEIIVIPKLFKDLLPINAEFCQLINDALWYRPDMSLKEFAQQINEVVTHKSVKLLMEIERCQLNEIMEKGK